MKNFPLKPLAVLMPVLMLMAMWMMFFFQQLGFFSGCRGAIIPLVPAGLKGVLFSPLLHGDTQHIINNSLPMAVFLFLLFQFYSKAAMNVFLTGWVSVGLLVWLMPPLDIFTQEIRSVCIIGASGLIYYLAFYLFFSGIFRRERHLLTISLLVALYYGGMIWGIFPQELLGELNSNISWQSHLAGTVLGTFASWIFRKKGKKEVKFIWQYPNYYSEKDDKLWQKYREENPEDFLELPAKKDELWEHLEEIRRRE